MISRKGNCLYVYVSIFLPSLVLFLWRTLIQGAQIWYPEVGCSKYLKTWKRPWNWVMGEGWESFKAHAGKSLDCLEGKVGRTMDIRSDSRELSGHVTGHVTGNWKKGNPHYRVAPDLAELGSSVLWMVEFASDEIEYFAEVVSKQSVQGNLAS